MNNANQDESTQFSSVHTSSHQGSSRESKIFHIGKNMSLFLLGVLVGVILMGLYNIIIDEQKSPSNNSSSQNVKSSLESSKPGKDRVTEEDLKNYAVAKDCSTISAYSSYTMSLSRLTMKTISLEDGLITAGREGGTNYVRWQTLPVVFDDQCSIIKLSDIKAGDIINIYTQSSPTDQANSNYASDTKAIQKVN